MSDKNEDVKDGFVDTSTPLPENSIVNDTISKMRAELDALRAEQTSLELEERKYKLIKLKDEVAKLQQERATRLENIRMQSMQIIAQIRQQEALQAQCTHMKGGVVTQSDPSVIMNGHGSDATDYAFIRHILPAGNMFILCQRCLKEWYGPNRLTGESASEDFEWARTRPTKNHVSGSSQFYPVRHLEAQ